MYPSTKELHQEKRVWLGIHAVHLDVLRKTQSLNDPSGIGEKISMYSMIPLQAGRWESVDHFVAVSGGAYLGFSSEWVGVQGWRMPGHFDRFRIPRSVLVRPIICYAEATCRVRVAFAYIYLYLL